jgi:predicted enzyme related to lactoylglutathione lyase
MAETIAKAVKSGGSVLIPPQTLPAGDQMAILRDPMGVTFGVVTPAKAV